jgi:hypothetical protein
MGIDFNSELERISKKKRKIEENISFCSFILQTKYAVQYDVHNKRNKKTTLLTEWSPFQTVYPVILM